MTLDLLSFQRELASRSCLSWVWTVWAAAGSWRTQDLGQVLGGGLTSARSTLLGQQRAKTSASEDTRLHLYALVGAGLGKTVVAAYCSMEPSSEVYVYWNPACDQL